MQMFEEKANASFLFWLSQPTPLGKGAIHFVGIAITGDGIIIVYPLDTFGG
jgi:hypothetical protein